MSDIIVRRTHQLGLRRAREVARQWAEHVERKFEMVCRVSQGETDDVVEFERPGVSGRIVVASDHFDVEAHLGFLLWAFRTAIEGEIARTLDQLLAAELKVKRTPPVEIKSAVRIAKKRARAVTTTQEHSKKAAKKPARRATEK